MKPYLSMGGKPAFHEFITPIGLIVHSYHDKPQLKTKDQYGKVPDIDEDGIQRAEYKVTLAWSKTRMNELQELVNLGHTVKGEAWPESMVPGAFFALEPFFRDGDNPAHNTKQREYLRGRYYLNFKQKAVATRNPQTGQIVYNGAPGLLGPHGPEDKILPVDIYPGCTGRVSGILFGTEYMGKHFISTRLNNIQKYQDGERIGGGARPTPESQFGSIASEGVGGQLPYNPLGSSTTQTGLGAFGLGAPAQTPTSVTYPSNQQFGFGQPQNRGIL